eukprot:CAMPEP_0183399032 /NCGR_PEP_ID=MMETSP0370-20130417/11649_1 /TAXON_ID=268820 /ORGANISM="Peridinium aciculiferum, Strain PAER-2" /LENGTH=444 /DNA_ID=CAMNT_0025580121 /DNA_START=55 /DNA_END=1389 /DNA_ORIENTATION=+
MANRRAQLLPVLGLAALALLAVCGLLQQAGTFAVPGQGAAQQSLIGQRQQLQAQRPLQPSAFARASASQAWNMPMAQKADLDLENQEASWPLVFAATALAASAAAVQSAPKGEEKTGGLFDKLKLPIFVACWYFFNVQYNIQNKMLMQVFDATWAVSFMQLAAGIPIAMLMWATGFVVKPKVTTADIIKLAPVGAAFAAGQVFTVASLGAVAVSFTHVVKALEPAVNAIASALILGQVFHPMVYASLLPVFAGVALASSSELSFTMFGFATAMASNFAFVTRNVLATKFGSTGDMGTEMIERKTNQLAVLTIVATAIVFPLALLLPGGLLTAPAAWSAAIAKGIPAGKLAMLMTTSSFYFFMYQLSSFWVLSQVPPITHSVLNTLKRVVIIIISIFVFKTPVTPQSAAGTSIAIGGVLLYTVTKNYYSKKAKEAKAKEASMSKA